jgi:hypothetical protein
MAHRDDGKRYVIRSDEKLTAFLEAEKVTRNATHQRYGCDHKILKALICRNRVAKQ